MDRLILTVCCILSCSYIEAQETVEQFPDSAILYEQVDSLYQFRRAIKFNQCLLSGFQNYVPSNGINLGNIGTPVYSFSKEHHQSVGFKLGMAGYNVKLPEKISHYWVNMPYTRGMAVLGSKKEQMIKVFHTQNIKDNWNVSLNIGHINSLGFYKRQRAKRSDVNFGIKHFSVNKFHDFNFNYLITTYSIEENGGVKDELEILKETNTDRTLSDVRYDSLGNITEVLNVGENRDFRLKQYFNFGQHHYIEDSVIKFSDPKFRFVLDNRVSKEYYKYDESDVQRLIKIEEYDDTTYIDSTKTNDATVFYNDRVALGFESLLDTSKLVGLGYHVNVGFENGRVNQNGNEAVFGNSLAEGGAIIALWNQMDIFLEGRTVFSGYNKGEYNGRFLLKKWFNGIGSLIFAEGRLSKKRQDYYWENYYSNHYKWQNNFDFKRVSELRLGINCSPIKAGIEVKLSDIRNHVYFETQSKPIFYNKSLRALSVNLKDTIRIWKFYMSNNIIFNSLSDEGVIPLPKLFVSSSLYFQSDLFKNVAHVQIGAQVRYYTAFYAGRYNPSLNTFVNQFDKKYGDYPFVDFFVNARVKKVKVFFKIDHLNAGLFGNSYFTFPNKPYHDRSLKLGLEWIFLN